ncbi:relaxase/mobilization nuclease domain-containing protein [Phaeobacter inhibens]|uniref:relaxase/mobilization nuclease domain-containing protein n=1 Tax=Phaeobacter inhibens TaxID=221822 RepID=UPI0026E21852|nr:relaxase/mobilization nuclease domain-containing protein [Phaeobacter inhibens]MDO6758058.1 relaxase/mobilization nuclease domain-containing protein [Phaeobacter inhibens]
MNPAVMVLLDEASRNKSAPSALDAVMGKDWAHYRAGNPSKAAVVEYMMRQQKQRKSAGVGLSFRVGRRTPQALVKMVTKGGASDVKGLRAQMDYLRKDGTVELQRSERHFGADVDEEQQMLMETAWGMDRGKPGGADKTSHFVVSFPIGTDRDAAARAGRAWAEEMFGSGRFGDRYDYYTADHRDTQHPHTHVVVARRGLENGLWLKVSRRSELNFDVMREIQVEMAAAEGIELEASPRLARGVHDRPIPTSEFWKVKRGLKPEPEAPRHTEETMIATAATIVHFSRQMEAEKRVLVPESSRIDKLLGTLISTLRAGHEIEARSTHNQSDLKELKALSEEYVAKRTQIIESFREMDREIAEIDDPIQRVALQRRTAVLRSEAAALLPDNDELQAYRQQEEVRYHGIAEGGDEQAQKLRDEAQQQAADIAKEAGLNPDEVLARYNGPVPSAGLARQWRELEVAERIRSRSEAGQGLETPDQARQSVEEVHRQIDGVYREADGRLAELGVSLSDEQRASIGRATVSDIERGVSEQFEGKADKYTRFEPIVVHRNQVDGAGGTTANSVALAEELKSLADDREAGNLSSEQNVLADAIIRDTINKHGPAIRAALVRDDSREFKDHEVSDPEAYQKEVDQFEQKRLDEFDGLVRRYGLEKGVSKDLDRTAENELAGDTTDGASRRGRDQVDIQQRAKRDRGGDGRGHDPRDDDGHGL